MKVSATFSVAGTNTQDLEIETEGKTLQQIVDAIYRNAAGVTLCHACSRDIGGVELEGLQSFTVGGRTYEADPEGGWASWSR